MKCPKCKCEEKVKDGTVKGKQRYKCKKCAHRYTLEFKDEIQSFYKRLALVLYIEGMGFREIGRILGVSNVTVLNWIKGLGINSGDLGDKRSLIKEVGLNEMHIFLDSNKTKNGCGSLLITWDKEEYNLYLAVERSISSEKK
jgi:transposase